MLKTPKQLATLLILPATVFAGPLDSPAPPTDPASAMYSLDDICNRLTTGAAATPTPFNLPPSGPTDIGCSLNDIMNRAPIKNNATGAQPSEVISGKQYWGLTDSQWGLQTGTLPNHGAIVYTPSTTDQPIATGYHNGSIIKGLPNLRPENIKQGVTILGVTGTYTAPATPPPATTAATPSTGTFRDTLQDGSSGPEMVVIPAGTFKMGDIQGGGGSDEQPVHDVTVARFAMGKYEVTFAEYDQFAEATGRSKPDDYGWGRGNRPVIYVSWDDVTAYAEWLTQQTGYQYRLPTEAEWEYAARGGTQTKYWWGNEVGTNNANCSSDQCGDSFQYTSPVGSFAANPFGLHDTAGNLWEWTCSEYENPYNGKEKQCLSKNYTNIDILFVLRGGSWFGDAMWMSSSIRDRGQRAYRIRNCGARLARSL